MKKGKENNSNLLLVLMIICVLLSLTTLGIVAYDKYIKTDCSGSSISCHNK